MSTVIGKIDIESFDGDGLEIVGNDGINAIIGGELGDFIQGEGGDDELSGRDGADLILGGAGRDLIEGGSGGDALAGEAGDDTILGGGGRDLIEGGSGGDALFGQGGDDYINGAFGDDEIRGGRGDDTIRGGAGSDVLFGGEGADVFEFSLEDFAFGAVDEIADFNVGQDSIVINGLDDSDEITFNPSSNTVALNGEDIINLTLSSSNSFIEVNEQEDDGSGYEIV